MKNRDYTVYLHVNKVNRKVYKGNTISKKQILFNSIFSLIKINNIGE